MDILQTIILSIIEGITEFLPVSSTGHLILASKIMGVAQTEFVKSFEIFIQLGAILAVAFLYWKEIFLNLKVFKKILIAFLPTAFIGFILYKLFKQYLLGNEQIVIWSLLIGGIILILFDLRHKEKENSTEDISKISYKNCFLIGLFQSISIIPGVSRAGATIIGGLSLGLKRETIVKFSFLLAIPTMLAASLYDLYKSSGAFSFSELDLLIVGFLASFVVALFSVKFFIGFIRKNTFVSFGVYRILVALLFLFFI
ncbi:MAG TPA: undecaprenyl-diphosphatase UppP [Candidatus Nanoarchaeia archaeon]|nr:undecaprenyl-diphosphatase UppP [Candidatus Nanoarchaeia archaeon]